MPEPRKSSAAPSAAELPSGVYLKCSECGKEGLHEVLKGRVGRRESGISLDALTRCTSCGAVRRLTVKEEGERNVPAMLSDSGASARCAVPLDPSAVLRVGDELMLGGLRCIVTSLEVGGGRRERARGSELSTVWLKRFDRVRIKVSVNVGRRTLSRELWLSPDEELGVGDVVQAGAMRVLIHSLHAGGRRLRRGAAKARDIKRIYGREVE